jgi:glycosyltransferase involved in cell wall biosynthesis
MRQLSILTWHTHGSYLYYLSQAPHRFHVVHKPGRPPGYGGRCGHHPWGDNVVDLPADQVRHERFDCIIFQDDHQYLRDQFELLSAEQRRLPRIYIEHDTPRENPTDMRHPVDDPDVLLVHVTAFNALMWNNGRSPVRVIEHGVHLPGDVAYRGERERGLVVVNHLAQRGRRLGADVFAKLRERVPLDLIGMGSKQFGGLGEVIHGELPAFMAAYRFFFHPVRYTSLGLAVIEAMMTGLPIVALATTEMATVIDNGKSGFIDTNPDTLAERMRQLLREPALARQLGAQARRSAFERFNIARFVADWNAALALVTGTPLAATGRGVARPSQPQLR